MDYIITTNLSTIASTFATVSTATAAASPVIEIVVRVIIGAAVLIGVSYAAWRYRAEIKAGFKYTAKKIEEVKILPGKLKLVLCTLKIKQKKVHHHCSRSS
ncbi:MAG: hypothetical protein ACR5K2_01520 [Wolbachia sp.]